MLSVGVGSAGGARLEIVVIDLRRISEEVLLAERGQKGLAPRKAVERRANRRAGNPPHLVDGLVRFVNGKGFNGRRAKEHDAADKLLGVEPCTFQGDSTQIALPHDHARLAHLLAHIVQRLPRPLLWRAWRERPSRR